MTFRGGENEKGADVVVFVDYAVTTGQAARRIVGRAVEAFGPQVTLEHQFLVRSDASESPGVLSTPTS